MKIRQINKMISTVSLISILTTVVMAGPGDESFEVPTSSIRKGPSVGTVEKLTFDNGQFRAIVNGTTHKAKAQGEVLTGVIERNLFEQYISKGNKISLKQGLGNSIEVEAIGQLLGGGKFMNKARKILGPFGPPNFSFEPELSYEKRVMSLAKELKRLSQKGKVNIICIGNCNININDF